MPDARKSCRQVRETLMCFAAVVMQAAKHPKGSIDRLLYVAAFSVSAFQSVRNMRCSLPIMGETVEVRHLLRLSDPLCLTHPCTQSH